MKCMGNISKWKVIGLNSKQVNTLRELHRSQAKGILCKKYNKEYLKIIRNLREKYIRKKSYLNLKNLKRRYRKWPLKQKQLQ